MWYMLSIMALSILPLVYITLGLYILTAYANRQSSYINFSMPRVDAEGPPNAHTVPSIEPGINFQGRSFAMEVSLCHCCDGYERCSILGFGSIP